MNPPPTGYSLRSVHTIESRYLAMLPADDLSEERDLQFRWDWRFEEGRLFEVLLGAKVGPSADRPDDLEAVLVARFELIGDVQTVELERFVTLNAPALLMPYLRQALTMLSTQGPYGPFYLPPVNVKVLSEQFALAGATGARQLRDTPELISGVLGGGGAG